MCLRPTPRQHVNVSDIENLGAAIREQQDTIRQVQAVTNRAITAITQANEQLIHATRTSGNDTTKNCQVRISSALESLSLSRGCDEIAINHLDQYLREIGASTPSTRNNSNPIRTDDSNPGAPHWLDAAQKTLRKYGVLPEAATERATTVIIPDFDPRRVNPACFQGLAPRQKGSPCRGNLFFPDGRRQNDVPVESGRGLSDFKLDDIKPEYLNTTPAQGHIEGRVAAWMIETKTKEMTLYINESICEYDGKGCLNNIKHFLPEGYILNVWARNKSGSWERTIFQGTGKAFKKSTK